MSIYSTFKKYGLTFCLTLSIAPLFGYSDFLSYSANSPASYSQSHRYLARQESLPDSSRSLKKTQHTEPNPSSHLSPLSQRKGEFFFTWGYNRSAYTYSDINFSGQGYNFTLNHVKALDAPTEFSFGTYFGPSTVSIPQFNFRLGYYFNNKYSLSIGWDHMKYVMVQNQQASIDGTIAADVSNPSIPTGEYQGVYDHAPFKVAPAFLTFEHTDGLNYASLELDRLDNLWTAKNGKMGVSITSGAGIGAVVPRSDVRLFTVGQNNLWNIAGFGASVKGGIKIDILKNLFVEGFVKGGYIDLLKIRTTGRDSDRAKQEIGFLEGAVVLGYKLSPFKKK